VKDQIITVLIAILGSSGLIGFIQFLIARYDGKKDALSRIEKSQQSIKRDGTRTQLLMLIADYPDNTEEIMTLAERYFIELGGNWYMSTIFKKWLSERDIPAPEWYKGGK